MKIGNWFRALEWINVSLGQGDINRFVFIEIKYLFSIYLNIFNTIEQDRYHNHAFNAVSIMMRGWYYEYEMTPRIEWPNLIRSLSVRFIPRDYVHKIGRSSPNAISITLAGPWAKTWTEIFENGNKKTLTWGRKVINQERG